MFDTKRRNRGSYTAGLIVSLAAVVIAGLLLLNRQFIVDQMVIWQYQPTTEISAMVDRTSMTGTATRYFYASRPAVEDSDNFNKNCGRKEQGTAILGCYNGSQIFIYDVTDARLDGVREVTAAHEMLHAAYDRLSDSKRQQVDQLLEVEYNKLKSDAEFTDRMAFYARTEPGERDNELHSVIGTEVSSISPELESYYRQYFTDRSVVTKLHDAYAAVFSDLQAKGQQLTDQLTALAANVDKQSTRYNKDVAVLNDDIAGFNARATSGGFVSQAQFQSERATLTSRAVQLDDLRAAINADVTRYNQLRADLERVAGQSQALNRSIDSTLAPAPSL